MDSLAGKWNTLKENMTKGLTSAGVREALKGVLDVANNVVLAVEKIGSALGGLGTAGALVGLMSFIKTMSNLDKAMTLGTVFSGIDNVLASIQGASGLSGALSSLTAGFKNLGVGATASKVALGLFKGALVGLAFTAVIAGIKACVDAFDNYVNATEKAVEASKLKQDGIRDELQTLSSQKSGLQEIAKEYDTLSSKSKLTYQEASRFKELKQQIAQIAPDLVSGYDASGDPILKLNGSLTKYISTLDKAIAKQEKLYQAETRKQANEYLKQNDKNGGSVDDKKYRTELDYALQNAKTRYDQARKLESDYTSNSVKWAKQRIKARDEEAKANQKELEEISRVRALASEKDQQIQQAYIDDFQKRSKIAKEEYKNQFTNFMGELDWSQLGTNQANQLSTGLQKLSEKTAFTMQQLSSKAREATRQANEAFKDTGAINTYGKALQKIAEDSGKFDIQSWSGYLDEVNARFEAGAMTTEQYSYSLGIMADTMSSMTGVPASVFETALKGTGDLEVAFQNATTGLNNFLSAYGKSTMDLEMGDSIAESLTQQFEDLLQFGNDFDLTLEKEGKIECSWLVQQKDSLDLPKQMEDMIDLVVADGEVTEVEQKVLMGVQTEIKNEGQLKDETVKTIEGLLDGTLEIDKGIEIAGIKLNAQEAEQLKKSLQEAGISAKDLKLGDTGIEKAEQQAQALEQELSKISDTEIRLAIEEQGFDSAEKVQNLVSVLETVPEEKKTQFIADTGEYFNNANSVEEAIKSMPDELKIKYNVGVEGDERLESLKSTFDSLPESIQTKIGVENGEYTVDQIQMIKEMVDQFGETDANAFLSIEGAPEALAECTTVEEFLQRLQEMVVEGKITVTAETEEAEEAQETLEEVDGEEATATVSTELNEDAYNKLQEALDKIHGEDGKETKSKHTVETEDSKLEETTKKQEEANGKETKSTHKVETEDSKLDETKKKQDEVNGKETKSKHKVETESKELDEAKKKQDEANGKQTQSEHKVKADASEVKEAEKEVANLTTNKNGTVTLTVSGKEQIQATINDKKQLEVNGQAVTTVQIAGGEQYSVAVNEKGQLEVNGVAQTQIDVSGSDQLVLAKNEKGQLEVNGQAVTDIQVNGKEEVSQAKQEVDNLTKEGNKNVSINIDVSLKDTVGEIMSRLGFNKKTEEVQIKVTCDDQATPILQKITGYQNKNISVTINAKDNATPILNKISNTNSKVINVTVNCVDNASAKVDKIKSMPSAKQITVTISCQNGGNVLNIINQIASKTIPSKTFSVTCNGQSALGVLNNLASKVIPSKTFSINCNDNATSKVSSVIGRTIPNKTFTVTCNDKASAVLNKVIGKKVPNKSFTVTCRDNASGKLSSIISKLSNIRSKSISVTTTYRQVGKPPKTQSAGSPEIIKLAKPSFGSGATQAISGTTQALGGEIQAINNNAETLNNAVSTTSNSAELMASKKVKANIDTSKTIDAVKHNIDLLTNMSNLLSKLATQIDTLKAKQQRTWGSATTKLLKEQISLLTKQQSLTKVNIKNIEGMSKKLKSSLKKQGFKFKDDGSISNYNSKLIAMEKNVEKLKKKEESYKGKSEKTKDKLSKAYEKANDQLQQTKNKLSEYYDLQFSELPNAKKQWEEYANAIAEAKAEIIKADREARTFFENMREDIVNARIDRDTTNIEILELKADLSSWSQAVGYIEQANELLIKNQKAQTTIMNNAKSRLADNKAVLDKYGFNYTKNGWLTQPEKTLEKLRKTQTPAEYEAIKEAYDEYVEDMYRTIPEAEKEWWSLQQAIEENKKKIEETNRAIKEMVDEASVSVLVDKFDSISRSLDLLEVKMEGAFGVNKRPYMEDQIELLNQMQTANKNIIAQNEKLMSQAKDTLWNKYHILFDDDGNITNLAQRLEVLNDLEDMEVLQDLADRYTEYKNAIDDATISIEEEKNQIQKLKDSMLELEQEMKELRDQAWIKEFENGIKLVQNKIDKLDSELNISGSNQVELLNEKIKTYEKLAIATEDSLAYQEKRKGELSKTLISYGFEINDDGTINDTANKLEALKNTLSDVEFEIVSDTLEGYFEVALDTIPELEKTLLDYQKELQDIQKTKLEKTQRIEDEITKIYEKQIEERKKLIEEEAETQVKVLNKAKDAYNRYRDEVDYRDDYEEQLKTVEDLLKKLEIAKRDDSLAGQKRVEDLQKQLLEEQKNLEKLVQDKIDNDINNMFDDQIDKIQTDADEEVKKLEDTWTESKIAEAVQQALDTGIFTSIDGEIKSLNTALIEFANTSSDYFGVMGAVLKSELIDNLKVAYSTMDEIQKIYNDLNVSDFSDVNSLPNVNIQGSATGTPINNNTITIGDTNITVEGSADSQTVEEIELMLKDYQQKIYADIMKNVK